jgi:hypothetical protein
VEKLGGGGGGEVIAEIGFIGVIFIFFKLLNEILALPV